ncbi:MAG: menaquinone-dependent protoporphyrinogen IX dehydrogenase [Gammaproteobacteria bacterium]|tara:strand:+ start:1022 stop:1525 length:504 start_codon:yes stop_codon:yes gene_type:complete
MQKSIIIYSSVDGHTKEICEKIAGHMIGDSDIFSVDDNPEIQNYEKIIIGASIRYGKYRTKLFDFIESNIEVISEKENAFFSVNVVARKAEKNTPNTNPYVQKFLNSTTWIPNKVEVFAGKIDYPKYKFLDKYAIKFIMLITKGPTDTSKRYEFTDWDKVKNFAKNI